MITSAWIEAFDRVPFGIRASWGPIYTLPILSFALYSTSAQAVFQTGPPWAAASGFRLRRAARLVGRCVIIIEKIAVGASSPAKRLKKKESPSK